MGEQARETDNSPGSPGQVGAGRSILLLVALLGIAFLTLGDRRPASAAAGRLDGVVSYDNGSPAADIDVERPLALLLGNEAHGLPAAILSSTDHVVSIPMGGAVESLNVATAGAVLAFDYARRLRSLTP